MPKRMRTESGPRPTRTAWLKGRQTRSRHVRSSGRKSRNALVSVPRNKLAFPQSLATSLRYADDQDFVLTSANTINYAWLANGLFDPYVPAGGHQPRGFDELMAQYTKFTVKSSRISVTFYYEAYMGPSGQDSTGNPLQNIEDTGADVIAVPPVVGMVQKSVSATTAAGEANLQMEKERTVWTHITPTSGTRAITTGMSTSDFFGKDFLVGSDGYTGTTSADPVNKIYYHVKMGRLSNEYASPSIKCRASVVITYNCVFTEPKPLGAS